MKLRAVDPTAPAGTGEACILTDRHRDPP
jgi:hypothetical protein